MNRQTMMGKESFLSEARRYLMRQFQATQEAMITHQQATPDCLQTAECLTCAKLRVDFERLAELLSVTELV